LQQHAAELERRVEERTAQLRETNAALEAFSYTISHDLRAPLRAMQGIAQALLEDYGDRLDATGLDYARRVVASAQQMDTLIQDLLAYSRLGRADLPSQPVNLQGVVAEALGRLSGEVRQRDAEVSAEGPFPPVLAHEPTLVQVVTNLLANALKFVPPGVRPRVRVWAEERHGAVRLWAEDNGIGIAPAHQGRIFDVFERLHGDETYPGTGIGLAIVRKGVERMGGRAGVESAEGQGSRFWVELPKG
jgi:signal transduction histidine kinase